MGKIQDELRRKVAAKKAARKKAAKAPAKPAKAKATTKPAAARKPTTTRKKATKEPAGRKGKIRNPNRTEAQREADRKRLAARTKKHEALAAKAKADAERNDREAKAAAKKSVNKPKKPGMRPYEPTVDDRRQVQTLAGLGLPIDQIRVLVLNPRTGKPPSLDTFKGAFSRELAAGPAVVNSQIAAALLKSAKGHMVTLEGGKDPKKQRIKYIAPSVQAQIFMAKVRLGWKEDQQVTVNVNSGVLVPPSGSGVQDWLEKVGKRNAESEEPGGE